MDTLTINRSLEHLDCFVGTFSRDNLPEIQKKPAALVVNTDDSSRPGEHWVAIFIPVKGPTEYFDSYGLPPLHPEMFDFLARNSPGGWIFSDVTLQSVDSSTCGHYCIFYLLSRCHEIPQKILFQLFTTKPRLNDLLVRQYTV